MQRWRGPALALLASALLFNANYSSHQATAVERPPSLATTLRFIGRDVKTGMPVPIDDRYIAEVEQSYADYGKVPAKAEPPPPVTGLDVRAVTFTSVGIESAPVARFGVDGFGRLDVPQDTYRVGWNPAYSHLPGTGGATFFAAHYEYGGQPGVFNRLASASVGAVVTVTLSDGQQLRYRVVGAIDYVLASFDMAAILAGPEGVESITLMTCSGPPTADGYPHRTVVVAVRES